MDQKDFHLVVETGHGKITESSRYLGAMDREHRYVYRKGNLEFDPEDTLLLVNSGGGCHIFSSERDAGRCLEWLCRSIEGSICDVSEDGSILDKILGQTFLQVDEGAVGDDRAGSLVDWIRTWLVSTLHTEAVLEDLEKFWRKFHEGYA